MPPPAGIVPEALHRLTCLIWKVATRGLSSQPRLNLMGCAIGERDGAFDVLRVVDVDVVRGAVEQHLCDAQVADGKTNKEVAAAMFLSPKTVEFHLGRIFRKLGVTSRTELARRVTTDMPVPLAR